MPSRPSLENDFPFVRAPAEEEDAGFEALASRNFFFGGWSSVSTSKASSYRKRDFDFEEDTISSEGSLPFPPLVVVACLDTLDLGRCSGCCAQNSLIRSSALLTNGVRLWDQYRVVLSAHQSSTDTHELSSEVYPFHFTKKPPIFCQIQRISDAHMSGVWGQHNHNKPSEYEQRNARIPHVVKVPKAKITCKRIRACKQIGP